jgi:hypothetical protein
MSATRYWTRFDASTDGHAHTLDEHTPACWSSGNSGQSR